MHWKTFCEKASKINKKLFFKKTHEGYEVWDIAAHYGPGFPRKYRIMLLPYKTNALGFSLSLKKLKRGNWNRRLALQNDLVQDCLRANRALAEGKKEEFRRLAKEIGKSFRPTALKAKDELGITDHSIRNKMKGVMWDDTKKVLQKMMEARGAYQ